MLSSLVLGLIGVVGTTGLDTETLPCPNPVSAWTGTINAIVYAMAVDRVGSVYISGYYGQGSDLDPTDGVDQPGAQGQTSDAYVIKVNGDGTYAWAYTAGGEVGRDGVTGVALDADQTIVVTGYFEGTVDFDPGPETDEHTAPGEVAAFITWLTSEGTYLGTITFGGPDRVIPHGIALDAEGNVLLVGYFHHRIDFDPGGGEVWRYGFSDAFVSKLGPDGSHLWTNTLGGSAFDDGDHIEVDSYGNVYASGTFRGTVDFNPTGEVDMHTMVGSYEDVFVTKYYADGSYAWTRTYDVDYPGNAKRIAVAHDGGVVLTGLFFDIVDFNPGEGVDRRTAQDDPEAVVAGDVFVTKLNPDGSYGWTYTVGDSSGDAGSGVAVDEVGNVFITGHFSESVDFDPRLRVDLHVSQGQEDVFVTKLSSDGTYQWTRTFGGDRNDKGRGVTIDGHGHLYVFGFFREHPPYVDFDPGCEVDIKTPHRDGIVEHFITKLVCPQLTADLDGNGVIDLRDAAQFQLCFTDEGPTVCGDGCSRLDLHPDDDIDLDDFYEFVSALTGP